MRKIALITALLLLGSVFVLAQSGGDQTPPGGDMLGSDYLPAASGQLGEQSEDAAQNQRITGTYGDTKGYGGEPAYAGGSEYLNTQAMSSTGVKGEQGEASAIAGRTRAEDRVNSPYDTQTTGQGTLVSKSYLSGRFEQNTPPANNAQPAPKKLQWNPARTRNQRPKAAPQKP